MRITVVCLALFLVGCATRSSPIVGPNGGQAFVIKCGSGASHRCYEEAASACPLGYAIVDSPRSGGMLVPAGNSAVFIRGPQQLFVECKT